MINQEQSRDLKVYTTEQQTRILQFRRAAIIVHTLDEHQTVFDNNAWLVVSDPNKGLGLAIDRKQAGMMKKALVGMFDELLEYGLRDEVTTQVPLGQIVFNRPLDLSPRDLGDN